LFVEWEIKIDRLVEVEVEVEVQWRVDEAK
jgi:hypothetical protein